MSRRINQFNTINPTAYADTTAMASGLFPFMIRGGSATQISYIWEISIGGQASASAVMIMQLAMDSTLAVGTNSLTVAQTDAPLHPATATWTTPTPPAIGATNSTSGPQRSATLKLFNFSFNAYGGGAFWRANRIDECAAVVGNAVNLGEMTLSAFTGTAATTPIGDHVIYETL
jgi:hypothetical protein